MFEKILKRLLPKIKKDKTKEKRKTDNSESYVRKISKYVSSKLYHIENSKTVEQTEEILISRLRRNHDVPSEHMTLQ